MRISKALLFSVLMLLAIVGVANPPVKQNAKVDQKRLNEIYHAIRDRTVTQNDIWFKDGDFPKAVEVLKVLHGLYPHDFELTTDLGWMLENIEKNDEALAVYIAYHKDFSREAEAAYPEGDFYSRNRLWSKVVSTFEPTMAMVPRPSANAYRMLARAYERLQLYADSVRIWNLYLEIAPTDGQAKVNRTRVQQKLRANSTKT